MLKITTTANRSRSYQFQALIDDQSFSTGLSITISSQLAMSMSLVVARVRATSNAQIDAQEVVHY